MEVIVALGVTMIVMMALLPQLLVGLRGAALANEATEAKGVVQGRLEQMRNLPFHVAPSAERRIDLLDTYFPDLRAPDSLAFACKSGNRFVAPASTWSGYVTGAARRCEYEPATGSFYRKVEAENDYVLVTDTQFLDSVSRVSTAAPLYKPIVAETAGPYDSQGANGVDTPVSAQVGVTVTAFFLDRGTLHPVSAYTQVSEVVRTPTRVTGVANARALEVGGIAPDGRALSLSAGDMNIVGTLTRSSSVTANTNAASARLSTNDSVGDRLSVVAPPAGSTASRPTAPGTLPTGAGCTDAYLCWGAGVLDPVIISADGGLPAAGSATSPVESRVTAEPAVSFRNAVALDPALVRAELDLKQDQPLLGTVSAGIPVAASACGPSRGGLVSGRGFLQTTATRVDSCVAAATTQVALFRTGFAQGGVLRITLTSAQARCTVDRGVSSSAQAGYQLTLEYAKPIGGGYTSVLISRSTSASPVGALPPLSTEVSQNPVRRLNDYIESWTLSAPSVATSVSTTSTTANASLPGSLKLISQPLRNVASPDGAAQKDPDSVVSLTLGSVGCDAEDAR